MTESNIHTSSVFSYLETVTEAAESDLLQPGLDLAGLPVCHAGKDAPRNLLPHHSESPLGKGRGCAVAGVHDDSFEALHCSNLLKYL